MAGWTRWTRPLRSAAWRVGLLRDPTRAAARAIERWLDDTGQATFVRSGVPGLAVVVRFASGREIRRCYGTAGEGRPVRDDTTFQALSISKPVTAMVALTLVDEGRLSLDEPVGRRLRAWRLPADRAGGFDVDGITLRRLLSHSAGLNVPGYGWTDPTSRPPAATLLASALNEARTLRLVDAPGARLRYSGAGFSIVELLVEEATGRPFAQVARERLLAPLGVTGGGYEFTSTFAATLATRHDEAGRPLPAGGLLGGAASGLHATAPEVATLWAALAPGPRRRARRPRRVVRRVVCRDPDADERR